MTAQDKTAGGKTSNHPVGKYIILILFCWLVTIGYLGTDTVIREKGEELATAKQEVATVKSENDRLRLNIAKLSTPEHIEEVAKNTLGMVEAEKKVYYIIEEITEE